MYAHKLTDTDRVIGYLYGNECICNSLVDVHTVSADYASGEMTIEICESAGIKVDFLNFSGCHRKKKNVQLGDSYLLISIHFLYVNRT